MTPNLRHLLLILAAAPAVAATVVIQPVAVTASSTFWTYNAQNLINGSGLSGGLHDGNYNNHWMTDTTGEPAWLVFDLGKVARLADIRIWNYNVDFGMGYSLVRGAKDPRRPVSWMAAQRLRSRSSITSSSRARGSWRTSCPSLR